MSLRTALLFVAIAACDNVDGDGGGEGSGGPKVAESGTKRGSASGFSATVSAELAKGGPIAPIGVGSSPAPAPMPAPSPAPAPGSAAPSGSAAPAGSAMTPAPASGSAAPPLAGSAAKTVAGSAAPLAPAPAPTPTPAPTSRAYQKPNAELASIKFELEPNWERDMGLAGTFSLEVKVPNTDETRVFYVRYGLEDQAAPVDCDLYRKHLDDTKTMTTTVNRQRGAACYIEGTDSSGPVYRYLLTYGGKRLICHGSLYKEAALGDLRDKVLMQAKKICETLAL